jgi:UDP-N-acetylglucosamine 2-epimerase
MKTIAIVAGARPNFMKIAPIVRALRKPGGDLGFTIIHTGQHYGRIGNSFASVPRNARGCGVFRVGERCFSL